MTTPNGTPSVSPSPRNLGESLQDPSIASTQAHASGGGMYNGSGEPAPKVVGEYMEDVHHRYTDGATVADDQSGLNPVGVQPEQTT
jgi:hypothetical protein